MTPKCDCYYPQSRRCESKMRYSLALSILTIFAVAASAVPTPVHDPSPSAPALAQVLLPADAPADAAPQRSHVYIRRPRAHP
ncbi:hypothetical protein B0H21DRAFT_825840 [Amylocystis lapponica]|nr:hypothetical protein B0H21DRAFT_825840 [Amylocystis lapponica]